MVEFISHLKRAKHHIKKFQEVTLNSFQNIAPRLDNQMELNNLIDQESQDIEDENEKLQNYLLKHGFIEKP